MLMHRHLFLCINILCGGDGGGGGGGGGGGTSSQKQ